MKFQRLRKFVGQDLSQITKYVGVDLHKFTSDLFAGLTKLTFSDNFESFDADLTLSSGSSVAIPNQLKTPAIDWWPVRITGDNRLVESGTAWTKDFAYLKNAGATTITATVRFVKR